MLCVRTRSGVHTSVQQGLRIDDVCQVVGLQHLTPDNLDETSVEGKIFRLERKLKRNLPNDVRIVLENQLTSLKYERDHPGDSVSTSPAARRDQASATKKSALNTGARRKVGAVAFEDSTPTQTDAGKQTIKKTKRVNKAAPVIQHPQTMHRMQDWKAELDRRIREQQELDAQASHSSEASGGLLGSSGRGSGGSNQMLEAIAAIGSELQPTDSPLASLGKAFTESLSSLTSLLGKDAESEEQEDSASDVPALPPQTFSRRL